MKKILSLLLCIAIVCTICVPVFAVQGEVDMSTTPGIKYNSVKQYDDSMNPTLRSSGINNVIGTVYTDNTYTTLSTTDVCDKRLVLSWDLSDYSDLLSAELSLVNTQWSPNSFTNYYIYRTDGTLDTNNMPKLIGEPVVINVSGSNSEGRKGTKVADVTSLVYNNTLNICIMAKGTATGNSYEPLESDNGITVIDTSSSLSVSCGTVERLSKTMTIKADNTNTTAKVAVLGTGTNHSGTNAVNKAETLNSTKNLIDDYTKMGIGTVIDDSGTTIRDVRILYGLDLSDLISEGADIKSVKLKLDPTDYWKNYCNMNIQSYAGGDNWTVSNANYDSIIKGKTNEQLYTGTAVTKSWAASIANQATLEEFDVTSLFDKATGKLNVMVYAASNKSYYSDTYGDGGAFLIIPKNTVFEIEYGAPLPKINSSVYTTTEVDVNAAYYSSTGELLNDKTGVYDTATDYIGTRDSDDEDWTKYLYYKADLSQFSGKNIESIKLYFKVANAKNGTTFNLYKASAWEGGNITLTSGDLPSYESTAYFTKSHDWSAPALTPNTYASIDLTDMYSNDGTMCVMLDATHPGNEDGPSGSNYYYQIFGMNSSYKPYIEVVTSENSAEIKNGVYTATFYTDGAATVFPIMALYSSDLRLLKATADPDYSVDENGKGTATLDLTDFDITDAGYIKFFLFDGADNIEPLSVSTTF